MKSQKKVLGYIDKVLTIRLVLTAVLAVSFLIIFFCCGGTYLLLGRMGDVKCFADNDFEVHFIDVGQGDCTFIRFPDNTNLLIDAGTTYAKKNTCDYLDDLFRQENIKVIDRFLFSHHDSDHIGGAAEIFDRFQVNTLYRPTVLSQFEVQSYGNSLGYKEATGVYYSNAMKAAYSEPNCKIVYSAAGLGWEGKDYSVTFLSPSKTTYTYSNDYSAVVKITYKERSFLFTGDAEEAMQNEVIENFPDALKADVLKVPHHGAQIDTNQNFFSLVQPKFAFISVGENNSFGHPTEETLRILEELECKVYTTADLGSIAVSVDKNGEIVIGGKSQKPIIDVTIVIAVFVVGILVVWGVQPSQTRKKRKKKKKKTKNNAQNA